MTPNRVKWSCLLLLTITGVVFAQEPPPPPGGDGPPPAPDGRPERRQRGRDRWGAWATPTREELESFAEFARQHSPKRWDRLEQLPGRAQTRLRMMLLARYRALDRMKQDQPALHDLTVRRIELEDEIFGLANQMREAAADEEREAKRIAIREKVGELVDNGLAVRAERLKHWEQSLAKEREDLERERADREKLVEDRLKAIESHPGGPLMEQIGGPESGPPGPGAPPPPPSSRPWRRGERDERPEGEPPPR